MSRKGTLILTEARSGSNWLGSLSNRTGLLGVSEEWIAANFSKIKLGSVTFERFCDRIIELASTPNGYFCIKIFPRHLLHVQIVYGRDLIMELEKRFDTQLILLKRQDRFSQAVSFARAKQSGQWKSTTDKNRPEVYDFKLICRCFASIERSYSFWDSYIAARTLDVTRFIYEDLVPNPDVFVKTLALHAGIAEYPTPKSELKVQRNDTSKLWVEQFKADLKIENILESTIPRPPHITLSNLIYFFRKRPQRPRYFDL